MGNGSGSYDGFGQAAEREVALQRSRSSPSATNHLRHVTPGPELKFAKQKTQAHVINLPNIEMDTRFAKEEAGSYNIADLSSVVLA